MFLCLFACQRKYKPIHSHTYAFISFHILFYPFFVSCVLLSAHYLWHCESMCWRGGGGYGSKKKNGIKINFCLRAFLYFSTQLLVCCHLGFHHVIFPSFRHQYSWWFFLPFNGIKVL